MKRYFNFYHFVLVIPILVLYTNCDGFQTSKDSITSLSQCANSASHSLKLLRFDPDVDCFNKDLIRCEIRSFSPSNENETFQEKQCIDHPEYGEVCLNLTRRHFNTKGASREPADYTPGGAYNYDEVNCHLQKFTHNDVALFSSSNGNLESSLSDLYLNCSKGKTP